MNDQHMTNRLHICQTCERDGPLADDGTSRGQRLSARINDALGASDLSEKLVIRKVPCLSGCLNPCNVSFRATGKASVRFGKLTEDQACDVVKFANLYVQSVDGDVDRDRWPESMREKMTARTPAPPN